MQRIKLPLTAVARGLSMKSLSLFVKKSIACLFILSLVIACTSGRYITINYNLPPQTDLFDSKTVTLRFKDSRSNQRIFGPGAQKDFERFTGVYSLTMHHSDSASNIWVGAIDLPNLFQQTFKQRLENLGIQVLREQAESGPTFEIALQEFLIDKEKNNWTVQIAYEAGIYQGDQLRVTERVSGSAERTNVIGPADADKVLGEIFTDVVNKLNIDNMFQSANL